MLFLSPGPQPHDIRVDTINTGTSETGGEERGDAKSANRRIATGQDVKVVFFASVRESIGEDHEILHIPAEVEIVDNFMDWMRSRGPAYEAALSKKLGIRVAVDHVHATSVTSVRGADEIAIFPMMTGG